MSKEAQEFSALNGISVPRQLEMQREYGDAGEQGLLTLFVHAWPPRRAGVIYFSLSRANLVPHNAAVKV